MYGMTTPTDHWAQLSGATLVAELRDRALRFEHTGSGTTSTYHALHRAAKEIEAQAQEIYDLRRRLASAARSEHRRLNDSLKRSYEP